jgi:hypothetical protein
MVEMNNLNSPQLVEAVRLWTGWGLGVMPSRDDARLARKFGDKVAAKLLPVIKSLEEDFYSSDARLVATDLQEMGRMASEQFKRKHPTVAEEIVEAFAWCYTFDFK